MTFARDTFLIFRRQLTLSLRNPAWVVIGLSQPILYLVFFGPLLAKIAGSPPLSAYTGGNAYRFFVPGLLVQLGLFGASFVGFGIIADWRTGVVERMRVTPVSRMSILLGRVMRDVVVLLVQAVVLTLAGLAFGMRAPLAGVLIGLVFVALLAISLASVSYTVGLLTKSEDVLAPLLNMVMVPLMLLSGIMLPMQVGPSWLNWVSRFTPFRYVIDAMRDAFQGHYLTAVMAEGAGVTIGLAAACLLAGARTFIRENA